MAYTRKPYRRRAAPKRKGYKKRAYRKRSRQDYNRVKRNNLTHISKISFLPITRTCVMNWAFASTFTSGINNLIGGVFFSVNGLFQPLSTSAHQPMGFDQAMIFYNHYTVTSSKISVNFINEDGTSPVQVLIAIFPDTTLITDPGRVLENGQVVRKTLLATPKTNPKSQGYLSMYCDVRKENGLSSSKRIIGDSLFRGDSATNPTEQSWFMVGAYNLDTTASVIVDVEILIEYNVTFTEPRKIISS